MPEDIRQAFSARRRNEAAHLNDNVDLPGPEAKNSELDSAHKRAGDTSWSRPTDIVRRVTKMVPEQISETVAVVKVPNYEEKYVESILDMTVMKRYNDTVMFRPTTTPVHYAQTLICYKDSTRKRFVSRTYYEPRVKPKRFAVTTIVYPKHPEKTFASFLDYHIDECRKWFKTCIEFKAKTYTTTRMPDTKYSNSNHVNGFAGDCSPGASQVFLPRFNTDGQSLERKYKYVQKHDINQNTNSSFNGY